jgi:hypothetical protein
MKKLALALPFVLSACMTPEPGAIRSFNGSSVTVQTPGTSNLMQPMPATIEVAQSACPGARYVSTRQVTRYVVEFLFVCD